MDKINLSLVPFDLIKKEYHKRVNEIQRAKPKPETCRGCIYLLSGTKLRERFKIPFKHGLITGHYCLFNSEGLTVSDIKSKRGMFYGLKSKACENKKLL